LALHLLRWHVAQPLDVLLHPRLARLQLELADAREQKPHELVQLLHRGEVPPPDLVVPVAQPDGAVRVENVREEAQVTDRVERIVVSKLQQLAGREVLEIGERKRQIQRHVTVMNLVLEKQVGKRDGHETVVIFVREELEYPELVYDLVKVVSQESALRRVGVLGEERVARELLGLRALCGIHNSRFLSLRLGVLVLRRPAALFLPAIIDLFRSGCSSSHYLR